MIARKGRQEVTELQLLLAGALRSSQLSESGAKDPAQAQRERYENSSAKNDTENEFSAAHTFRIVPFVATTIEGIGGVSVSYGTVAYQQTKNSVKAEKRPIFAKNTSGVLQLDE